MMMALANVQSKLDPVVQNVEVSEADAARNVLPTAARVATDSADGERRGVYHILHLRVVVLRIGLRDDFRVEVALALPVQDTEVLETEAVYLLGDDFNELIAPEVQRLEDVRDEAHAQIVLDAAGIELAKVQEHPRRLDGLAFMDNAARP